MEALGPDGGAPLVRVEGFQRALGDNGAAAAAAGELVEGAQAARTPRLRAGGSAESNSASVTNGPRTRILLAEEGKGWGRGLKDTEERRRDGEKESGEEDSELRGGGL